MIRFRWSKTLTSAGKAIVLLSVPALGLAWFTPQALSSFSAREAVREPVAALAVTPAALETPAAEAAVLDSFQETVDSPSKQGNNQSAAFKKIIDQLRSQIRGTTDPVQKQALTLTLNAYYKAWTGFNGGYRNAIKGNLLTARQLAKLYAQMLSLQQQSLKTSLANTSDPFLRALINQQLRLVNGQISSLNKGYKNITSNNTSNNVYNIQLNIYTGKVIQFNGVANNVIIVETNNGTIISNGTVFNFS